MKHLLFPLLIFCLALTACGGKKTAAPADSLITEAPAVPAAQPSATPSPKPTSTNTPVPSSTPIPPYSDYWVFFENIADKVLNLGLDARSGQQLSNGKSITLNSQPNVTGSLYVCSRTPASLSGLAIEGSKDYPSFPSAQIAVPGVGDCLKWTNNLWSLGAPQGSFLHLTLEQRAALSLTRFNPFATIILRYVAPPVIAPPSGSGGGGGKPTEVPIPSGTPIGG